MPRWIASDQNTAANLKRRFGCDAVSGPSVSEPADALRQLLQSRNGIAVLPSPLAGRAVIASFRASHCLPTDSGQGAIPSGREPRQIATGFLGLVDELVWEDQEEEAPKRTWWRKLID